MNIKSNYQHPNSMRLNRECLNTFLLTTGHICPYCHSKNLETLAHRRINISGHEAVIRRCEDCGCRFLVTRDPGCFPQLVKILGDE